MTPRRASVALEDLAAHAREGGGRRRRKEKEEGEGGGGFIGKQRMNGGGVGELEQQGVGAGAGAGEEGVFKANAAVNTFYSKRTHSIGREHIL